MTTPLEERAGPLEQVTSLKLKLGLLVAVSVTVAAVLATIGAGSVPALLSIPVTVLLALGVTQLLASGMIAPLRQMTAAARQMAAGDYDVRVRSTATDEVGELARNFNRMAAELAAVDRQRRELVATVSHELRTPLAALVAVLENLADGVGSTDPATLRVALGQAERLSDLVEDLLDLSRVDAGALALDRRDVDLRELIAAVITESGGGRDVVFRTELPDLVISADPRRLHQLVANLLDNASRHSPSGGTVRVSGGRSQETVWFEVLDEGPGIAPPDRDRVFERYGTVDGSSGGTGLGLAIARWVTELHGGRIGVLDAPGGTGARFRVELPVHEPGRDVQKGTVMSTAPTAPAPPPSPAVPPSPGLTDGLFGSFWRELAPQGRPWVLAAAVVIGVLAGVTLPFEQMGLATTVVMLAAGGLVAALSRHRTSPFTLACGALGVGLALLLTLRAAEWVAVLALFVSVPVVTSGLTRAHSFLGMLLAGMSWPLSGLRGMPWLGRSLRVFGGPRASGLAVARTFLLAALGVLVFGALFASADAVFGEWIGFLVPDLGATLVFRAFITVAVAGIVLAAAYLALNPPDVEPGLQRRPLQRRFEWLAPVLVVDAVFALFLAAQAAAFLGGHDYVRRTTGLTYAEYVHQGFAQMTIATILMLVVTAAAAKKADLGQATDRAWLRGSLGLLCVLTLAVVASALHRMDLYQDAYGFTRLRLVVDLFEAWLGLVVVAVLVAGVSLRGWWLPRMALLSGAGLVLALGLANPDAWIARHNVDRFNATGKVDWMYLHELSADATPTLVHELPPGLVECALGGRRPQSEQWTSWNLGRARAKEATRGLQLEQGGPCPGD